jgi:hypothetical protein
MMDHLKPLLLGDESFKQTTTAVRKKRKKIKNPKELAINTNPLATVVKKTALH